MTKHENFDASDFIGGTFLTKDDLTAIPERFRILGVSKATFPARNGNPAEDALQLEFHDHRRLSLNKTNLRVLMDAYGRNTGSWLHKDIGLFHDPSVTFAGRAVGGVRVAIPSDTTEELLDADDV